jgi:ABC-type glycerol-3-phosphate transport system substrate-binding protein
LRTLWRLLLFAAAIASGLAGLGYFCLFHPQLFKPGPYHPMSLYYAHRGVQVHPYHSVKDGQYRLVVWETGWPLSWSEHLGFADFAEYMVLGFQESNPNVEVEFRLIRITELALALQEARALDTLPDIYAGPFFPALAEMGAVPLEPFIDEHDLSLYEQAALEACTVEESLVAWPRWVEVWGWASTPRFLGDLDASLLAEEGWSWEEAEDFLLSKAKVAPQALVLDSAGTKTFEHLLTAAGVPSVVSPKGELLWQGGPVLEVARFLEGLKSEGVLPRDTSNMHKRLVADFLRGEVAMVGPAGSGFLRLCREVNLADELVMLPVPHPPGGLALVPAEYNAATVFDKGDPGRAALAARLALHLSRGPMTWLTARVCGVPAYLPDRQAWRASVGLPTQVTAFLEKASQRAAHPAPLDLRHQRGQEVILYNVILPEIREFWQGKIDHRGLEESIRYRVKGKEE